MDMDPNKFKKIVDDLAVTRSIRSGERGVDIRLPGDPIEWIEPRQQEWACSVSGCDRVHNHPPQRVIVIRSGQVNEWCQHCRRVMRGRRFGSLGLN